MSPPDRPTNSAADPLLRLMERIRGGDRDAFEQLFTQTQGRLRGAVMRIVRDEALADDVVIETYAKAWRLADRFDRARGPVASWLGTLARRHAIDTLRKRGVRLTEESEDNWLGQAPSPGPGPGQVTSDAEGRVRIQHALGQLPTTQRMAIEAAFYRGLTHPEIAEALGEALGTIKTRIRTGLIALRRTLEPGEVGLS